MVVGAIYIPPEGSTYAAENNNYFDIICDQIGANEHREVDLILCGDLNACTASVNELSDNSLTLLNGIIPAERKSNDKTK